ncbi:unnamed protein product [Clonostachys rosea]|uniref:Heterokaryon incompatibility domain-containing protein n=1 Tax=Bionectria ochroleuca TaxID=29856 RepID=A0ABY6U3N1_BIOOC|nr:unnamed protein product [Clonostachys rosea]
MVYIAISHVWHASVAELQYRRSEAHTSVDEAERLVLETPVRVFRGLAGSIEGDFEIWHDYVSVPQWIPELKRQIIGSIPEIFKRSQPTVAHFSDVNAKHVRQM